ncbi:MAG: hypothetical protein KBD01_03210 [Acidobacteria bacterium]|nr:hypothetical protein [Acidobacteriota bacterium]
MSGRRLTRRCVRVVLGAAALAAGPALAQSSASFRLAEHALNAGGHPLDGIRPASANFRAGAGAIGDAALRRGAASTSFRLDGGFTARYGPPSEVAGVRVHADHRTVSWDGQPAATAFNVYRDALPALPGSSGACLASRVGGVAWVDAASPAPGTGWFYLVSAENRLWEEGSLGSRSDGTERANSSPCP